MIDLLNNNAGVITAIQTLATICLSVIAIIVTILVARIPYKKKLTIYSGLDCDEQNNCNLELYLYNAGNVPLYIKDIQIQKQYKNKYIDSLCFTSWSEQDENEKNFLAPRTMFHYQLEKFSCTEEEKSNTNMLIVITTEEKTFKEKISWAVG